MGEMCDFGPGQPVLGETQMAETVLFSCDDDKTAWTEQMAVMMRREVEGNRSLVGLADGK